MYLAKPKKGNYNGVGLGNYIHRVINWGFSTRGTVCRLDRSQGLGDLRFEGFKAFGLGLDDLEPGAET